MSVLDARPLSPREAWRAETEGVNRGDLVELLNVALRNGHRTWPEQQALLAVIDSLDCEQFCDVKLLRSMAESSFVRSHVCDCGSVTSGYWCSLRCQRDNDGPYGDDD